MLNIEGNPNKGVLDVAWSIAYHFIWDGHNEKGWRQLTKKKENGEIGLKDIHVMATARIIKWGIKIWSSSQSLWTGSLRHRYVQGRDLNATQQTRSKSNPWASSLRATPHTDKCSVCGPGYDFIWKVTRLLPLKLYVAWFVFLPTKIY